CCGRTSATLAATALSTAALAALTLPAGRRATLAGLAGLELSSVSAAKAAADTFDLELLFVGMACSGGSHLPLSRRFNGGGIDLAGHIISRQTGAGGFGADVGARVEQCLHGGRMPLFNSPH